MSTVYLNKKVSLQVRLTFVHHIFLDLLLFTIFSEALINFIKFTPLYTFFIAMCFLSSVMSKFFQHNNNYLANLTLSILILNKFETCPKAKVSLYRPSFSAEQLTKISFSIELNVSSAIFSTQKELEKQWKWINININVNCCIHADNMSLSKLF